MISRRHLRRRLAAWCLFDFANSSYTTLIVTVVFAVYFREVVVDAADNSGDRLWGMANFLAMFVVVLVSPVMGAIADRSASKRPFLIATTLMTVVATALLYLVTPGRIALAVGLYVIATVGFEVGYVFYNAFLPEIAPPEKLGRVSGWGWAVGFSGGLTALVICSPWIGSELRDAAGKLVPAAIDDRRVSFLIVAVFYLVFALPAFVWLQDAGTAGVPLRPRQYVVAGIRRVADTLRHLGRYRETAKLVVASLFFNDGITTVIIFAATFATVTFGLTSAELTALFIAMNVIAFPATVAAGYIADRVGSRRTLAGTLLLWIAVVVTGFSAQSKAMFLVMAAGAAIGMGSTQAVARSFMAEISPADREAEFFGFYVMSGKFASIFGPLLFGTISAATGSQRLAVLSLLPLFALGLGILLWIDEGAARSAANKD